MFVAGAPERGCGPQRDPDHGECLVEHQARYASFEYLPGDVTTPESIAPECADAEHETCLGVHPYFCLLGDRSGGVSSVLLFETEAGARDWMAYETSDEAIRHQIPGAKIKRFQVLDVPGAHGWTGPDLHGNAIGHVYWTQGRCMMLIGLEVEGPRVERLSAGAKAIYERTGGTCPD